jgi:rfaE bifunctional protein kinase chain/domain
MTFADLLAKFHGRRMLVVGDAMLDQYIYGQATRISQEAPVLVVRQSRTRHVPGGAANVARNLRALGAVVRLIAVVGCDAPAATLRSTAEEENLAADWIEDPQRPTTTKTRVLANHAHQVLRIDHEHTDPIEASVAQTLVEATRHRLPEVDGLLLSDYRKGAIPGSVIEQLVAEARARGCPVFANAKPASLPHYRGAQLVSVNRPEAAASLGRSTLEDDEAQDAAARLREQAGVENLVITLDKSGVAAAGPVGTLRAAALPVEVYDEAGAGDTAIAALTLGVLTAGLTPPVAQLAMHCAAAVVQKVGVAAPSPDDLERIGRLSPLAG